MEETINRMQKSVKQVTKVMKGLCRLGIGVAVNCLASMELLRRSVAIRSIGASVRLGRCNVRNETSRGLTFVTTGTAGGE